MSDKPILAIPLGDAAGVGPEVTVLTLLDEETGSLGRPLLLGQRWVLEKALQLVGREAGINVITRPEEARYEPGVFDLIEVGRLAPEDVAFGKLAAATGKESGDTLAEAGRLVGAGRADGLVSAPINKAATGLGGYGHGHMEIVADALNWDGSMYSMLAGPTLKVVNVTGHSSLLEAIANVTPENILRAVQVTQDWFAMGGNSKPRFAVCALNPHKGESGVFGNEEEERIAPAVKQAQALGINLTGPEPVDSVFARAASGEFDAVIALYHDQGFTPVKTVGMHDTASVGVGLPIPYATTDHGTGFDLAGTGKANAGSFKQALRVVVEMCRGRKAAG